jgi:hypothetical protein
VKKLNQALMALLGIVIFAIPALAGTWTGNKFFYKPDLGARGSAQKALYDSSLDNIDARLGKEIWVGDPNYGTTFQNAVTAIGTTTPAILRVPVGTINISGNLSISANITIKPERGAILAIATGVTLTINGGLEAGLYRIFSCAGTGKVVFGTNAVKEVFPEWWYSGAGDASPAIQAAINSSPAGGITVNMGTYTCQTQINLNHNYVRLVGRSKGQSTITFSPAGTATLFYLRNITGSTSLTHISLEHMSLQGGNNHGKTFIQAVDLQNSVIANIGVYDVGTPGHTGAIDSIGLLIQGRDSTQLTNFSAYCKRPIEIGANPHAEGIKMSMDSWVWTNVQTICDDAAGTNVKFLDEDMWITNIQINGLYMNLGANGLYWDHTTASAASQQINLRNVRYEQTESITAHGIHIKSNLGLYSLVIENFTINANTGLHLRKVYDATIIGYIYSPYTSAPYSAGYAYDFDNSNRMITCINSCLVSASGISLGGMRKSFGGEMSYGDASTTQNRGFVQFVGQATIGAPTQTVGTGLNDLISNTQGFYLGRGPKTYTFTISTAGAQDKFTWNNGEAESAEIDFAGIGTPVTVGLGLTIAGAVTGHTAGNKWTVICIDTLGYQSLLQNKVRTWPWKGQLAPGDIVTVPLTSGSEDAWKMEVVAVKTDGTAREYLHAFGGHGGQTLLTDSTANTEAVNAPGAAGKLSWLKDTRQVKNNLAYTADVIIDITWKSPLE